MILSIFSESQDRYSKADMKDSKEDSIFDSVNLLDSRENQDSNNQIRVLRLSQKHTNQAINDNNSMFGLQPFNPNKYNISNNQYNFGELYNINKFQTVK